MPPPVDIDRELEVAQAMKIPLISIPADGAFKGYLTEEDLKDLGKRDQKTVLAMSVVEQWGIWQTEELIRCNQHDRQLEAEVIKLKLEVAKLKDQAKEVDWKISLAKWSGMTLVAGVVAAFCKWIFEHIGK